MDKVFTIAIILLPILHQYNILPLEYLDIVAIVFAVPALYNAVHRGQKYYFGTFYLFCIISTTFSGLFYDEGIVSIVLSAIRLLTIFFGIVAFSENHFKYEYGKAFFIKCTYFMSFIVIIQFVLNLVFSIPTFLLVPNVTMNYGNGMNSSAIISNLQSSVNGGYIYRPSALFIEPADFGYFSTICLAIMLFDDDWEFDKKIIKPIIITLAAILTTSTIAIVGCLIIWALFLHKYNKTHKISVNYIWAIIIGVCVVFAVLQTDAVQFSINRKLIQFQNINSGTSSSTALRVLRGLLFFIEMSPITKIIGCGFGHLADYYHRVGMVLSTDVNLNNVAYMNSFFSILCSEGILGFCFYFKSFLKFIRSRDDVVKKLAIILLTLMLGGSVMDSGTYYIVVCFLISKSIINNKEYLECEK